jgi:hypothetical protein
MTSPQARLASAITANKKLRPAKRQTLDKCLAVPTALDFSQHILLSKHLIRNLRRAI